MRECGECTACCTLAFVPELGKREGVTCEHCNKGCKIYEGRPAACVAFQCAWLKGDLGDDMRPDLSKIMVENITPSTVIALSIDPNQPIPESMVQFYLDGGRSIVARNRRVFPAKGRHPADVVAELMRAA